MKITTLMYHDVVEPGALHSSGFPGAAADLYKLEYARFDAHLDAIAETAAPTGVTVFDALARPVDGAVLLTFDDGGASAMAVADRLEARGWRGHFFVTTDYIGRPGFLGEGDIESLAARGHVVGSHSCSHPERMSRCSSSEIEHEWRESVARLSAVTGGRVLSASVPGGFYSRTVAKVAEEAGITVLFNSEPTLRVRSQGSCRIVGRFAMERMSAGDAGRLAAGRPGPRLKQAALWQLKKVAKTLGGRYWLQARRFLLNRRG